MRNFLFILLFTLASCSGKPVQKNVVILSEVSSLTSMSATYSVWYGIATDGQPAAGIIPKKVDLRFGDLIVVRKHPADTAWTYVKRINDNR